MAVLLFMSAPHRETPVADQVERRPEEGVGHLGILQHRQLPGLHRLLEAAAPMYTALRGNSCASCFTSTSAPGRSYLSSMRGLPKAVSDAPTRGERCASCTAMLIDGATATGCVSIT